MLVEVMQAESTLPCFAAGVETVRVRGTFCVLLVPHATINVAQQFRSRFCLGMTEEALSAHVAALVAQSMANMTTRLYDHFQYLSNGIL